VGSERKSRAKPRVPGGYVDVPRHLYDAIVAAPFTLAQLKVVLVIVRFTWGYYPAENHAGATISQATIAKYSGLSRWSVKKAMPSLVDNGVVEVVRQGAGRSPDVLNVCTRPSQWGKFEPVAEYAEVPLDELSTGEGAEAHPETVAEYVHTPYRCTSVLRTGVPPYSATASHELPSLELPSPELPSGEESNEEQRGTARSSAPPSPGAPRRALDPPAGGADLSALQRAAARGLAKRLADHLTVED